MSIEKQGPVGSDYNSNRKKSGFVDKAKKVARIGVAALAIGGAAKYGPVINIAAHEYALQQKKEHTHHSPAAILKKEHISPSKGTNLQPLKPFSPLNGIGKHSDLYKITVAINDNIKGQEGDKPAPKTETFEVTEEQFKKYKEGDIIPITYTDQSSAFQVHRYNIKIDKDPASDK